MFAYLNRTLYLELLQPDDDFFTRSRKAIITIYLVAGIINIFAVTAAAVTDSEWPVLNVVNTTLLYVQSLIWMASWMYTRITRTSPDWLVNLVVDVCLCMIVIGHFSSPNWHWHAVCLSIAASAVVIGSSHMKLQLTVCGFLFLLNVYNTLGFPSILLPGSYKGSILIRQIINGVAACLALWGVNVIMKQFNHLITKSAANVRMAKEIAKMLAAYDTARALALLSVQEQSENSGDAGLVAVLTEIAHNLDKYRPHLPSYLLHQESGDKYDDRRKSVIHQGRQNAKATSVLGKIYHFLYLDLVQPDDNFVMRCRKAIITGFFIFGTISIFTTTAATLTPGEWSVLAVVNTVMHYLGSVIYVASWIYARFTRTSPDWLVNSIYGVALFIMVILHFSSPNWGFHAFCLTVAIGAVIIGTSHMKLQVAVSSFCFIKNAYDTLGFQSILLPGNYKGNILIRQITNGVTACLALWAVYVVMKQLSLLMTKSAADLQMAKDVSKMLASYDTAGALAYLSAQEESEDAGDAGLVAVLTEIAHNLDKYRPHIPNYIKGDDADGSQSRSNSSVSSGASVGAEDVVLPPLCQIPSICRRVTIL